METNEPKLIQSLHDLDSRLNPEREALPRIRASELNELAMRQRRNRSLKLAVVAVLSVAASIGMWHHSASQTDETRIAGNQIATITPFVPNEELQQILRDSEELIHETKDYFASLQTIGSSNVTFVDDASIVSLAVAQHYLAEGMIDESKRELEILVRVLPGSIGGKAAAKELATLDAGSNRDSNLFSDEGV